MGILASVAIAATVLALELWQFGDTLKADGRGVFHAVASVLTGVFSGDHHHAVGGAAAVECRGGSSLQYRNALNVVGVDVLHEVAVVVALGTSGCFRAVVVTALDGHTVDDEERLVVARERVGTTDKHLGTTAHAACTGGDLQSGDLSLQSVDRVAQSAAAEVQVFAFHLGDSVAEGFLLSRHAEGSDDDVVERGVVGFEIDGLVFLSLDGLGFQSKIGDAQRAPRWDAHLVVSVDIGDGSCLGSYDQYRGAHNGIALSGENGAADFRLRHRHRCTECHRG